MRCGGAVDRVALVVIVVVATRTYADGTARVDRAVAEREVALRRNVEEAALQSADGDWLAFGDRDEARLMAVTRHLEPGEHCDFRPGGRTAHDVSASTDDTPSFRGDDPGAVVSLIVDLDTRTFEDT